MKVLYLIQGLISPRKTHAKDILKAVRGSIKAHKDGSNLKDDVTAALEGGLNRQTKDGIIEAGRAVVACLSEGPEGRTLGAEKIDSKYNLGDNVKDAVASVVELWRASKDR